MNPPIPLGIPKIIVCFKNNVHLASQCFNWRQNNKITIANGEGKLSKDEIKNMIQDARNTRARMRRIGIKSIPKIAWRTMFAIMKNSIKDEKFTSKLTQLTRNGLMMQLMLPFKGWTKTNLLNLLNLTNLTTRWRSWRPTTMLLLFASCTKGVLLNLLELHNMEVVL